MKLSKYFSLAYFELISILMGSFGVFISLLYFMFLHHEVISNTLVPDLLQSEYQYAVTSLNPHQDDTLEMNLSEGGSPKNSALLRFKVFLTQPTAHEIIKLPRGNTSALITFKFEMSSSTISPSTSHEQIFEPQIFIRKNGQIVVQKKLLPTKDNTRLFQSTLLIPSRGIYQWGVSLQNTESELRTFTLQ